MVTKANLTKELKNSGLTNRAASVCVDVLLEAIAGALSRGERIELRGFGTFYVSKQPTRKMSINGGMAVPEHGRVIFRPYDELRQSVWKLGGK